MRFSISSFAIFAAIGLLTSVGTVWGGEIFRAGGFRIEAPWARATIGSGRTGAVYMSLANADMEADRLVAIETPVAPQAHIHETVSEGNVMKMRSVDALTLERGESMTMAPGRMHVMLMKLTEPLKKGRSFPLTLHFEKAGNVTLTVVVGGPGPDARARVARKPIRHITVKYKPGAFPHRYQESLA